MIGISCPSAPLLCPWHSWIARETPTLKVTGSNPAGQAIKEKSHLRWLFFFYSQFDRIAPHATAKRRSLFARIRHSRILVRYRILPSYSPVIYGGFFSFIVSSTGVPPRILHDTSSHRTAAFLLLRRTIRRTTHTITAIRTAITSRTI